MRKCDAGEEGCIIKGEHGHVDGGDISYPYPSTAKRVTLPIDSAARKNIPMARGLLYYFPNALAEVARLSAASNEKHNPGEELHWSFDKSNDQADTIIRHLTDAGGYDDDGFLHDVKVAWRGLALLEAELIRRGAKPGRSVRITGVEDKPSPSSERQEVAYIVAKQLKAEGYDLNLASTLEGPRAKELWKLYMGKSKADQTQPARDE